MVNELFKIIHEKGRIILECLLMICGELPILLMMRMMGRPIQCWSTHCFWIFFFDL